MSALLHRPEVWLFTFVLAVIYPLADYFFYSRLKSTIQIYVWNILAAWLLSLAAVWLIFRDGLLLSDFGQNLGTFPRTLIVFAIVIALVAALVLINKKQKHKPHPEKLANLTDKVHKLLPMQGRERIAFVLVALTAGFCEEFLYRGWLLNLTATAVHSVTAGLLISSILFGFAHLYQGRQGVISTAFLGLVFGLIYVASGTLLPGQIVHTVMDLYNGLALAKLAHRQPA